MKKTIVFLLAFLVGMFLFNITFAQDTQPPLGLPTINTATVTESTVPVSTPTTTTRTASVTTQEAIDDAEVGTEVVMLVILSLVGGTGIFLVKKYFDTEQDIV